MKQSYKVVPLVLMMIALVSCYRDDIINQDESSNQDPLTKAREILERDEVVKMLPAPEKLFKVSEKRAAELAVEYSALFSNEATPAMARSFSSDVGNVSKKTVRNIISLTDDSPVSTRSLSCETSQVDTLVHIVNFAGDEGFAFISSDSREDALLLYNGTGNFSLSDTTDNPGLKMHVDMIMAYQRHKKEEYVRQEEEMGLDYFGNMDLTVIDEQGIRTFAANDRGMPGQPGSGGPGMPGGGGLPGSGPGQPNDPMITGCIRPGFRIEGWNGNESAMEYVQRRHGDTKCYGRPTITISESMFRNNPNYQNPPIKTKDEYFQYYGCQLVTVGSKRFPEYQVGPYVNMNWHQTRPLNKYCKGYTYPIGCAALAVLEIFAHYEYPEDYVNTIRGDNTPYTTGLREAKKYNCRQLDTIPSLSNVADTIARFARQLGKDIGITYAKDGSGALGLMSSSKCIKDVLTKYRYVYDYGGALNYENPDQFKSVKESLVAGKPIFIYGFPRANDGTGVILYAQGHCWVLHGYKSTKAETYYDFFNFDERGNLNSIQRSTFTSYGEFVCANMGGMELQECWVRRGVYNNWDGHGDSYAGYIYCLAGIKPVKMTDEQVKHLIDKP